VIANLDGFKRVHGVIAVPEIDRVFAPATGEHQMVAVDMNTLKIVGSAGPINYPDGLAYSPATKRVFVSDEHGVQRRTNLSPPFRSAEERVTPKGATLPGAEAYVSYNQ
jgi:DNA-binding beta-propeller fold protein YncE